MTNEVTTWLASSSIAREQSRQLARVEKDIAVAHAQVVGVVEVAQTALVSTGMLSMTKRQLEQFAPEDAAKLDHVQTTAVIVMGNIIGRMGHR